MRQICKKCGQTKDVTEFRKHHRQGGYEIWNLRECKDCAHEDYVRRYATAKRRKQLNISSTNWKKRNPEKHAKLAREYRSRHPEKVMAQNRLNYAIKMGRIKRMPCEVCGTKKMVHAHHVSYDSADWYNVHWLCYVCHKIEHG